MAIHIGTSGWSYDHWDCVLYPPGLPARDRLAVYCVMSGAGLPCVLRATAPFVDVRLHGPDHDHLYSGTYTDADLGWWADRIGEWERSGLDVYAYFNNDGGGNAVRNAITLRSILDARRHHRAQ